MKCHMESGELMSGCSSHVRAKRQGEKKNGGEFTIFLHGVNYDDAVIYFVRSAQV